MSRDTTDIANELLAENAALKGQIAQRDAQIARMEVELSGADERSKMIFEAKNHWADRARKAEAQIARLTTERDALREEKIGKNSNTRDAADIYFQLVEECEIPPGGSLVQYVDGLKEQIAALTAENVALKNGIGFFSYGTDSGFEEHDSAEKAIAAADSDIDYYRGDACDGWSEETDQTVWGVIMQRATMIDERPRTEEFPGGSCDYGLLPNLATPATDAAANALRAEGAIAARNALVVAGDGSDIYATVTAVIEQLREGK